MGEKATAKTSKVRIALIIMLVILAAVAALCVFICIREAKLRRAEYSYGEAGDYIIDGLVYEECDYREMGEYSVSNKVVCRTTDGTWTFYEIKEYPDHEYLMAYCGWDGRAVKLISNE